MRIALMGTRGIPANYGGFETFYEHLGPGLAARGHDVSVYIRPHAVGPHSGRRYRGVRLVPMPSIRTKHLETITHTFASMLHALTCSYDLVYVCSVGNTPLAWIPRVRGARVVLNVDSSDWKRKKWGRLAAAYLHATERFAARAADIIVADSQVIQARYRIEHGADARFFPYGANLIDMAGTETLEKHGLRRRGYFLWVGRLEPEARAEELIGAFASLGPTDHKLVIVGDTPYAGDYRQMLEELATPNVVFTGYQFGEAYKQLGFHASAYIQTSPATGTSPALLEQMASGGAVVVSGTPTNLEVIGDAGLAYDPSNAVVELAGILRQLIAAPPLADGYRAAARERVATVYSWDRIIDDYERLFTELLGHRGSTP
jgi:glycosyltransferase involved in cell wall biosynthesis